VRRGLALWLVLFAAYAATIGIDAGRGERFAPREVHVLLTAESVVSDGFVDLRDEYDAREWRRFTDTPVHTTGTTVHGRLLEPQGAGLALLIAPAYALGGPTAVELFLAALLALAFVLAAALGRRLVPEPWATASALVLGLSPPALAAATSVSPEAPGALALTAAALLALAVRDRPRLALGIGCASALAIVPWLALELGACAAVIALALARWLSRRSRPWAALAALDILLFSGVLYVTLHDRLFGGLTPYAVADGAGGGLGTDSIGTVLERAPRLAGLWLDRDAGLLRWAPFAALAFFAAWLLWRSRRDRLRIAIPGQVDVDVTAGFLLACCAAQALAACFLAPTLHGAWGPARLLVPVLPLAAALCAWGLRHAPRVGSVLAALTLVGSAWMLLGPRLGSGSLAPPDGDLPWAGAERALPVFGGPGGLTGGAIACLIAVGLVLLGLGARALQQRAGGGGRVELS